MDTIINYICEDFTTIIEKSIKNFISDQKSLAEFNLGLQDSLNTLACHVVSETLTLYDKAIKESTERLEHFDVVHSDKPKSILTSFGKVDYFRTYYKDKGSGDYSYLLDSLVDISAHDSISDDVAIRCVKEAVDSSYSKAGSSCCLSDDNVSKQSVKRVLHELDPKIISFPFSVPQSKKVIDYLYIEADEDHVAMQRGPDAISKLVYVHEGFVETIGKVKRKQLKNVRYFDGMDMTNDKLWEGVLDYIESVYDTDKIKSIYLSGDGASWIKTGVKWVPNSKFVLDSFHMEKYIKKACAHIDDDYSIPFKRSLRIADFDSFIGYSDLIIKLTSEDSAFSDNKLEVVTKALSYLKNHWDGIAIKCNKSEKVIGCSAEGHISHVFSNRLSSRPKGWSKHGLSVMSKLLVYKFNGGNVESLILDFNKEKAKLTDSEPIKKIKRTSKKLIHKYYDRYACSIPAYASGRKSGTYGALSSLVNLRSVI